MLENEEAIKVLKFNGELLNRVSESMYTSITK